MTVIIDTSSLLSLVRYYLPFDADQKLLGIVQAGIKSGEIVIIDAVYEECRYTSKGLVLDNIGFLTDADFKKLYKIPTKTKDILPPSPTKFYNLLNHQFRTPLSRRLNEAEFEERKKEFLEKADARMIIYALNEIHRGNSEIIIITEESENSNDHKAFKKIPAMCSILNIEVKTLPEWIKNISGVGVLIH